jgi:hypothetical protein
MAKPRSTSLDLKTTSTKQAAIRNGAAAVSPGRAIKLDRRRSHLR